MSRSVIRHKNPRGKLTHPSQGQELESAGRLTDQTKNIISSKKCKKVLYVTVIYTTNMVKESNEAILEQLHEHLDEFFKAVKAGNTSTAEFASAKSLAEELMVNHAQQPTKRFMVKSARQYKCPYCTQLYKTTAHRTEHVFFKHMEELRETVRII